MERSKVFNLGHSAHVLVAPASRVRKGYKIEPLGTSTPVVVVSVRQFQQVALADVAEVQKITPNKVPGAGAYKLQVGGLTTASLAYNANAAAIQTAIRNLTGFGSVTVSGDMTSYIEVTLTGAPHPVGKIKVVESTLKTAGTSEVQSLTLSPLPTKGQFRLYFGRIGESGAVDQIISPFYDLDISASDLQAALRLVLGDASLTVTGDFEAGLVFTYGPKAPMALIALEGKGLEAEAQQLVEFTDVPDGGGFTLVYGEEETAEIAFDDDDAAVQAALREIEGLESVVVDGNFTNGFLVTFVGVANPLELEEGENDLEFETDPVTISFDVLQEALAKSQPTAVRTTKGAAQAEVKAIGEITTPGDRTGLNDSVSQGEVLDKSSEGGQGDIYLYTATAGGGPVKVTEVF